MTSERSRRTVLKGIGVNLALPFMESLVPRTVLATSEPTLPERMAIITAPFGMVVDKFYPTQVDTGYELPETLRPLAKLKDDFTVFSNLDHDVRGGHAANHTLLSEVKSTERGGYPDGNITIDQRAAELVGHKTRFPSLPLWDNGMSFTRTGVGVPSLRKPSEAFKLLFVDDSDEQGEFNRASLDSSNNILDVVLQDARHLKGELGTTARNAITQTLSEPLNCLILCAPGPKQSPSS